MLIKSFNHIVCLLTAAAHINASSPPKRQSTTRYFFSFGDSYTTTGFDITSTKPSASNPFGNPPYPGYTFSNKTNWIDLLIESLAPTGTISYNFAFPGATVNASLVTTPGYKPSPPYKSTVLSLIDQTTQFSQYVASKPSYAPWTSADSVFSIWFGVNDVGDTYGYGQDQQATIYDEILTSFFNEVDIMYEAGGRNFIFLTVPPISRTPYTISFGTSAETQEATAVTAFNTALSSKASSWAASHSGSGVKTWIYDTTTPFDMALDNPTAYGAPNATCFNNDYVSCLWWDKLHPGQAIEKLVAEGVFATLQSGGFF